MNLGRSQPNASPTSWRGQRGPQDGAADDAPRAALALVSAVHVLRGTFVLPMKERSKYFFPFCYNPPGQKTTVLFLNQFPDRDIYCDSLNAFAASFLDQWEFQWYTRQF